MKQYVLDKNSHGQENIKCLLCNKISYNTNDILYKFCGFCHRFLNNN